MYWLNSGGGPLLLLAEALLTSWNGAHQSDGRPSDYERACRCNDYASLLDVGIGTGLILGDEPLATTWLPIELGGFPSLVRWVYANDEGSLRDQLDLVSVEFPQSEPIAYTSLNLRHLLFDSALDGKMVFGSDSIEIELPVGIYLVDTVILKPNTETSMIVHRFAHQK